MPEHTLRPIERRILQLEAAGMTSDEIGRLFRRSAEHIDRIIEWARLPQRAGASSARRSHLRPIERRILKLRADGLDHDEIGQRFRRGAGHIRRVEGLAHYKEAVRLLGS